MTIRGRDPDPPIATGQAARALTLWFTSPRQAARTLIGLARLAPQSRIRLTWTETTGAEADVVVARGIIAGDDYARVQDAVESLGVAAVWDPHEPFVRHR